MGSSYFSLFSSSKHANFCKHVLEISHQLIIWLKESCTIQITIVKDITTQRLPLHSNNSNLNNSYKSLDKLILAGLGL